MFLEKPKELLERYKGARVETKNEFLQHITNCVANTEWNRKTDLKPSAYLDVEVSTEQITLLNPKSQNVLRGFILQDSVGNGAKRMMAKRRLDIIDGNAGSYSRVLNCNARMESVKEVHELTAAVAEC